MKWLKNQTQFGWKSLVLQAHKNTPKCKNLVDSGLVSGWKLRELKRNQRVCKANVVPLSYLLFFLPEDRQIGKKKKNHLTPGEEGTQYKFLKTDREKRLRPPARPPTWKPKLHSPFPTLMRGDFTLFHCSAWVWNGLFISTPSHRLAPCDPIPQPPKIGGLRRIKECGVGAQRKGKGSSEGREVERR